MRGFPYNKWQTPIKAHLYTDEWEQGQTAVPPPLEGGLQLEDGNFLLQEDGFFILV
jgi:hypothetical protein